MRSALRAAYVFTCLAGAGSAATGSAAEPESHWQRAVEAPTVTEASLVAVPLDAHFYRATRDGWPDVWLLDSAGQPQAFEIRVAHAAKSHMQRTVWPANRERASVKADTGLQIEIALRERDPVPTGIQIQTPLQNFENQVTVETSADGETWERAGEPVLIFDYQQFIDARNDLVPFAAGDHRRFRITISDVTAEQESRLIELHRELQSGAEVKRVERSTVDRRPFRVERIDFYRETQELSADQPVLATWPAEDAVLRHDAESKADIFEFTSHRQPISAVTLQTPSQNFGRSVGLQAQNVRGTADESWQSLAEGRVLRLAIGDLKREDLTLKFHETRASRYRLVIRNGDSAPLESPTVTLTGPEYRLLFLAVPDQSYRLVYGSPNAKPGNYDVTALRAALSQNQQPQLAKLAAPVQATEIIATTWKPWNDVRLQLTAIFVMVLLLGWALYGAARSAEFGAPPTTSTAETSTPPPTDERR